jgi:hypothetical protein
MKARLYACAAALSVCLAGCLQDKIAGGSSEVDNPILVAFVDSLGGGVTTSGSLSIYLAGQNPALDPYPLLTKQVANVSSVKLTAGDFTGGSGADSAASYNILFIGDDSVGALLQNVAYDPSTGRYAFAAATVAKVNAEVVPLVRYEASLGGGDTGLVRVFIPGTPFQCVVVDSAFALTGVPRGTFSLRVLGGDGSERPLKPNGQGPGNRHEIDSSAPPIRRPPPPPPSQNLSVFAGYDVSLPSSSGGGGPTSYSLFGSLQGADPQDPRLGIKWRQVAQGPQGPKAHIDNPTSLNTRVTFPQPGAYQFILTIDLIPQKIEDTVLIVIEAPLNTPVFKAPTAGSRVYVWNPYFPTPPEKIVWEAPKKDTVAIDLSYDGGSTWHPVSFDLASKQGINNFDWYPMGDTTSTARLRLRNKNGETVATGPLFQIRYPSYPDSGDEGWKGATSRENR